MKSTRTCLVVLAMLSLVVATTPFAAQRGESTKGMKGDVFRASKLIGADVENLQGEKLGKLEDLVIDPQTSEIAYAVLSLGGFLGLGEKYFAVPWNAFSPAFSPTGSEEPAPILNVQKEQLKNAPGFDKNNWPDMANRQWGEKIHSFYGQEPYWQRQAARQQGQIGSTSAGRMGMAAAGAAEMVAATVQSVDEGTGRLKLQTSNGKVIELKAPEGMASDLQQGDRVQVVIRKQEQVGQSQQGASKMKQSQPGQSGRQQQQQ